MYWIDQSNYFPSKFHSLTNRASQWNAAAKQGFSIGESMHTSQNIRQSSSTRPKNNQKVIKNLSSSNGRLLLLHCTTGRESRRHVQPLPPWLRHTHKIQHPRKRHTHTNSIQVLNRPSASPLPSPPKMRAVGSSLDKSWKETWRRRKKPFLRASVQIHVCPRCVEQLDRLWISARR